MCRNAKSLEGAGADLLLVECIPSSLAAQIHDIASIPLIGIGAGPMTDGQILVLQDILDISPQMHSGRKPRFVYNFMEGADSIESAIRAFVRAVKTGAYPAPEHGFGD